MGLIRKGLVLACLVVGSAHAAEPGTVSWFMENPSARVAVLERCADDEAWRRRPACANASEARDRMARLQRTDRAPVKTPNQQLTSPTYYAQNPMARAATLAECRYGTSSMVTARDCTAARAGAVLAGR